MNSEYGLNWETKSNISKYNQIHSYAQPLIYTNVGV